MFLGIDIGTGSSKAVLVSVSGETLATTTAMHQVSLPRPGWAEFDAEATWWAEIRELCGQLFGGADGLAPEDVRGLCISGMGPSLVVTDAGFTPLRPAILYGIDTRATAEIDELNAEFGPAEIFADAGKTLSSQAVGPKLRWLQNHEPEAFARARRFLSTSSYIVAKLTGEYVLDHHTASQYDPLYDMNLRQWHPQRAAAVARHIPLPRLVHPADVVGTVTAAAAAFTGLPAGTPVCAGTVDAWAEALSAGVRRPGDVMLMYGSTMFIIQILDEFRAHQQLWTTAGVEPGALTLAAGTATSGSLTSWLREVLGDVPIQDLLAEAERVPPGSDGLVVLPYFAGERTPISDPHARGLIIGLTLRHGRGHLLRAAYEGMAFGIRQILELFESVGQPIQRLVGVGGGTQSALWTQTVADVTGRAQAIPRQAIGACYGDALMAAIGTGAVPPETDWTESGAVIEPNPENKDTYDELFGIYAALYPAVKDHMHALARFQEGHA